MFQFIGKVVVAVIVIGMVSDIADAVAEAIVAPRRK